MKIFIGADHGGYHLKQQLMDYLKNSGYEVEDDGNTELDPEDDYPQFATKVAKQVLKQPGSRGILICKGAQGMGMAANRYKGIRASVVWDTHEAYMTRNDNDSNVLCLSARLFEQADETVHGIVETWLSTPFSNAPRHHRRVNELDELG